MSKLDYNLATRRYWRWIQMLWIRLAMVLVGGIVLALLAYELGQSGTETVRSEFERVSILLRHAEDDLSANKKLLGQQARRIRELERSQEEMQRHLPEGELAEFVTLLEQRLGEGVTAEHLRFYINQSSPTSGCSEPESRRFLVETQLNRSEGGESRVSFDDGKGGKLVMVSSGSSATSADRRPEAWFDPLKPVNIEVTVDAQQHVFSRVLPLSQVIVARDIEYRLRLEKLTEYRAYASASLIRCVVLPTSP